MASFRPLPRFVSLVVAVATASAAFAVPALAGDGDEVRLLVTFAAPVDAATAGEGLPVADDFSPANVNGPSAAPVDDSKVQVLEFDTTADAAAAERLLARRDDVVAVEPDTLIYTATTATTATSSAVTHSGPASTVVAGFDTSAGSWGVRNTGQVVASKPGRAKVDVGATEAWPYATGKGVVVAVIDTGVDVSHPLLRDQLWRNPRAATPRTDPVTGRTYVNDVHGWNFAANNNRLYSTPDSDGHGTHVAGIIAGAADASSGFTGVAPDARLMVLKFLEGDSGRVSDAVAAIRYARDNGAHVINASWTSPVASTALQMALYESGLPVVTAAGNTARTLEQLPVYPVAWRLPNVVGVAAIDNAGAIASYSARSRELVDVVAPGSHILSTVPGGRLDRMSGTSQAAPHVTGALALALQHHRGRNAVEVVEAVRASVRPLPGMRDTRSGGLVRAPLVLDRLGTTVPACRQISPQRFTDVSAASVHGPAVGCLVSLGITQGRTDGTYGAVDGLTRGQVATMVARALERAGRLPAAPTVGRFSDVAPTGYVHRDAIEALAAVGIVRGRTETRFAPHAITTRAEFAAIVTRTNEYLAGGPYRIYGPKFSDTVGHADEGLLRAASGLRVVTGMTDGRFAPDAPVRRDQAASMLGRLLDRLVQEGLLEPAV
ncbi:S8 family serine peptidase [Egicoccus sp. AB-alg6-2]|uniref:S8 family serine peptidase n=1 Tax=Egicoccus sp. AB-alg6-2 TaxID=3242692 RepID=UPI00359EF44A